MISEKRSGPQTDELTWARALHCSGIGPVEAIRGALEKASLKISDIDVSFVHFQLGDDLSGGKHWN